jgi:chemotaxis protein methyltransferase CheR
VRSLRNSEIPLGDRALTEGEFDVLSARLTDRTGILFPKQKRREFQTKLAPMLEAMSEQERAGFATRLEESESLLQDVINRLTIGESYFFRNRPHFEALEEQILPALIRANAGSRTIRIWCAACSTGEEPYSLAILIKDRFPQLAGWKVLIRATDINTSFLERARRGVFTRWSFRGLDQRIIDRFFVQEAENRFRLDSEILSAVEFSRFNLSRPPFDGRVSREPFDLVLCRNVLIYFSFDAANRVIDALGEVIRPEGYLIVGHAESFPALRDLEAIYAHATYYYRKPALRSAERDSYEGVHTVSIPGLAVHAVERRPSIVGYRRSTVPPPPVATSGGPPGRFAAQDTGELDAEIEAARDLTDLGQLARARALLDRLVSGAGRIDHRVHFLRALVSDQENRTDDALDSLRQAIFLKKEFAVGHYYTGVICEREGDRQTAMRHFRNVVRITGEMPDEFELDEGGGMTAGTLREFAVERIREVALA